MALASAMFSLILAADAFVENIHLYAFVNLTKEDPKQATLQVASEDGVSVLQKRFRSLHTTVQRSFTEQL